MIFRKLISWQAISNLSLNVSSLQSGTVGPPKAVMLSHDSLTWDAFSIGERVGDLQPTQDRLVSFLPLSHVAAQVIVAPIFFFYLKFFENTIGHEIKFIEIFECWQLSQNSTYTKFNLSLIQTLYRHNVCKIKKKSLGTYLFFIAKCLDIRRVLVCILFE